MYVVPKLRGQRIARRFLAALEADRRRSGSRARCLRSAPDGSEALALDERVAFVHILAFGEDVDWTPITKQLISAPHR